MKRKILSALMVATLLTSAMASSVAAAPSEQWITTELNGISFKFDTYNGIIEKAVKSSTLGGDTVAKSKITTRSVSIPASIEGIPVKGTSKNAFCDGDDLASLVLPSSITTLGDYSFAGCDNITAVTIPAKVEAIPRDCFTSCDKLKSVTFGAKVKKIGMNAFSKCASLTSIAIPASVTEIESNAFFLSGLQSVVVPKTVVSLGDGAFKSTQLTQATVQGGIKTLPKYAFSSCDKLKSVTLGNGIQKIDFNAFENCPALTSVTIPDSVKNIADNAFTKSPNVTIYCTKGSAAEAYAIKRGINYRTGQEAAAAVPSVITVMLDGKAMSLSQPPVNRNGSVLVPMRAIFEALGAEVTWYGSERMIYAKKGVTDVKCWIDSDDAVVNNNKIKLPAKPQIVNGSTVVPARFVAETFGANVSWNSATQTVTIVTK